MMRKKIREIDNSYHCSIVGTCLSLVEVRELLEDAYDDDFTDSDDYILHGMAVKGAGELSRFSNRLTEKLDKKYRLDVFKSTKYGDYIELQKYWTESFTAGNIAGAYWALLSHPECTENLRNTAFGEIHMLSHLSGSSERTARIDLIKRDKRIETLDCQLDEYRHKYSAVKNQNGELHKEKRALLKEIGSLRKLNDRSNLIECGVPEENRNNIGEAAKLRKKLAAMERRNELLQRRVFCLMDDLNSHKEYNKVVEKITCSEAESCCRAAGRLALPSDLEGKKILLVGGRSSMVPHCKSVVELMNGSFLYHDGGKEQSRIALQSLAGRADIIICALDCVSHDASRCVKKICKGSEQKIIMLKNSGLSTFTRELRNAV